MARILAFVLAALALLAPLATQADPADVTAAARGVVRVVIVSTQGDQLVPLSHGTGFAVTPTRIVTNAHVVGQVQQDDTLSIAVVPPD
ncbi:MAG: serine protease, partial [Tsuneonella sp.]